MNKLLNSKQVGSIAAYNVFIVGSGVHYESEYGSSLVSNIVYALSIYATTERRIIFLCITYSNSCMRVWQCYANIQHTHTNKRTGYKKTTLEHCQFMHSCYSISLSSLSFNLQLRIINIIILLTTHNKPVKTR